ncbi:MAG: hypothetical protein WC481_07635 [Candidatus Omnitrophota bacterium]
MSRLQIQDLNGATKDVKGVYADALPVASIGGQYLDWLRKGYIFTGFTATPLSILKYDSATNVPSLWNPADSGRLVVPITLSLGPSAAGTEVIHSIGLNYKVNCGSALGTAAPISAYTEVAAVPNLLGSEKKSMAKWSPATNTLTAVGTLFMLTGLGMWLEGTPASEAWQDLNFEFNAKLALKPGTAIQVVSTPAASSTTYSVALTWAEIPYDPELWA